MKTKMFVEPPKRKTKINPHNILIEKGSRLPLSQQTQLAGDALAISSLLELINDIESKPEVTREIDSSKVDANIAIIEKLQKGEDYLDHRKTSLMPRPESADTVGHIKKRTGLQIKENSEVVINILNQLKNWPKSQAKLDSEMLAFTKNFLRDVHTGIMDHLETSDDIDFEW